MGIPRGRPGSTLVKWLRQKTAKPRPRGASHVRVAIGNGEGSRRGRACWLRAQDCRSQRLTTAADHRLTRPEIVDQALEQLTRLCMKYDLALVLVHHFNKAGRTLDAAIGGASSITRIARSIFVFGEEPTANFESVFRRGRAEESDEPRLVLACAKLNVAPTPPALTFVSTAVEIPSIESVHRVELVGEINCTAEAVFEQVRRSSNDESADTETETAMTWLLEYLVEGPRWTKRAVADAKSDGIAHRTFERARSRIKCVSIDPPLSAPRAPRRRRIRRSA